MAFTATTNLSLPIITTGTESGTWGDVVDNGLTSYLDIAIAGGLAIAITTADVTLTKTAGTSSATGIVSTTAQYAILNISGAKTAARNLNLPITSKSYIINNAGTGGFLLTVRGVTPTTGVTLVDGEECIVAWNGSDYIKVSSSVLTALTGTLTVANGGTGATTLTANNVVLGNGTSAPLFVAPSTSGNVLTSNGTTWQSTAPAASGPTGGHAQYTTSGTFTIPAGVTAIKMTVVAGGAAGGASFLSGCNLFGGGGGGAGGGALKWLTGLTPGNTLTVTVGAAGGASSVASGTQTITTVSATGGAAGSNATGSSSIAAGGAGGIGSNGDLNMRGGGGGSGSSSSSSGPGGSGGSSFMGGGGTNGSTGTYGGGGGGNSGAGSVGLVVFEY